MLQTHVQLSSTEDPYSQHSLQVAANEMLDPYATLLSQGRVLGGG